MSLKRELKEIAEFIEEHRIHKIQSNREVRDISDLKISLEDIQKALQQEKKTFTMVAGSSLGLTVFLVPTFVAIIIMWPSSIAARLVGALLFLAFSIFVFSVIRYYSAKKENSLYIVLLNALQEIEKGNHHE